MSLFIVFIGLTIQACEAADQVSDIFSAFTLYHGVLSDLSCAAIPLNGPCSTGVIGETVMPLARQAWPKSVHILVSFASPSESCREEKFN
ncbi:hypothetical protein P692DRAFT_201099312 [Suillus brevipes Sb2]|nr:hypothetical protein P692DRAFT_201099312 [Suillus brevipes Sb2]